MRQSVREDIIFISFFLTHRGDQGLRCTRQKKPAPHNGVRWFIGSFFVIRFFSLFRSIKHEVFVQLAKVGAP